VSLIFGSSTERTKDILPLVCTQPVPGAVVLGVNCKTHEIFRLRYLGTNLLAPQHKVSYSHSNIDWKVILDMVYYHNLGDHADACYLFTTIRFLICEVLWRQDKDRIFRLSGWNEIFFFFSFITLDAARWIPRNGGGVLFFLHFYISFLCIGDSEA
jgi:hypothetical protein